MKKQLAMKWVKNLHSGKFKQGVGRLRQRDFKTTKSGKTKEVVLYCCLGVLGETCGMEKEALDCNELLDGYTGETGIYNSNGAPKNGDDIKIRKGNKIGIYASLADANDDGVSFRSIANWIKRNYKKL